MATLPHLLHPTGHLVAFRQVLWLLSRHRQLTWEMTKRELQERYAGQMLGAVWALGHPLFLMAIYVFVFAYVFKIRMGDPATFPLDYTAYLLAGLVPWLAFQDAMNKGATVIVVNAGLVKQVVFPVEILPVKGVLASMFTELICLAILAGYVLVKHGALHWTWMLVPLLLLFQALAMVGVCYVLAAVGAFFRDVKDLIIILTSAGFFLIPALYTPGMVPRAFEAFFYLNPFSYMVWCFQDATYYGRFAHPEAWFVFPLLSVAVFYVGYRIFRKLRPMFGNVL
jgi:lipopolysaccharide transport system permease protein